MREDDVERVKVAEAICTALRESMPGLLPWAKLDADGRAIWLPCADAALAAMQPAPPAEPAPGTVRVRVAVWITPSEAVGYMAVPVYAEERWVRKPDAILVADVRPLTPPEVTASVEDGR